MRFELEIIVGNIRIDMFYQYPTFDAAMTAAARWILQAQPGETRAIRIFDDGVEVYSTRMTREANKDA